MPAAQGAGRGRSAGGRRLRLGSRLPAPAPGLAPVTSGRARPPRPAPAARSPMAPSRLQLGLRAAYSGLSSVAGFSIFLVWTVVYRQPGTAAMGGLAGTPGRAGGAGVRPPRLGRPAAGRRRRLLREAPPGRRFPGEWVARLLKTGRGQSRPRVGQGFWASLGGLGDPVPAPSPGPRRPASAVFTSPAAPRLAVRSPPCASVTAPLCARCPRHLLWAARCEDTQTHRHLFWGIRAPSLEAG